MSGDGMGYKYLHLIYLSHLVMQRSNITDSWRFCGKRVPRGEILFFSQIIILYIIIISCLINLSFNIGNQSLFICLLSSSVGYILPNPSTSKQKGKNREIKSLEDFVDHKGKEIRSNP